MNINQKIKEIEKEFGRYVLFNEERIFDNITGRQVKLIKSFYFQKIQELLEENKHFATKDDVENYKIVDKEARREEREKTLEEVREIMPKYVKTKCFHDFIESCGNCNWRNGYNQALTDLLNNLKK